MLAAAWLMLSSLLYSLQLSTGSFPKPLTQEEEQGVRSVLNAAALTYVASFVSALMQLLRLISIARRRD